MGGKFDRGKIRSGENSMFIVGVGKALIYPPGGCADPGKAGVYTEPEETRCEHVGIYLKQFA
jgi:hypothetical protein